MWVIKIAKSSQKKIQFLFRLFENYLYDLKRFRKHADPERRLPSNQSQLAYIVMLYHSIEKGLSLPHSRPGFGKDKLEKLLFELLSYAKNHGNHPFIYSAICSIAQYKGAMEQNDPQGEKIQTALDAIQKHLKKDAIGLPGGTIPFHGFDMDSDKHFSFASFAKRRHSVRQFADKEISIGLIEKAVRMAQTAPSVCNRQSNRVHVCKRQDRIKEILSCQQGNRGFGHQVPLVFIVTSSLSHFLSIGERNQCWIDGGLFLMTLIYGLQDQGIATCCLNWSVEKERDLELRQIAGIPDSENIVCLLAAGYPPEHCQVACSARRPLTEVLQYIE